MKKTLLHILVGIGLQSYTQNSFDAVRINSYEDLGTARSMGMAGSFGALGMGPQGFQINPANASNSSSSYISITPYVGITTSAGENFGYVNAKGNFNLSDLSIMINSGKKTSLFFSMNHQSDFHQELSSGYNGSLINHWNQGANSLGLTEADQIYSALPFGAGLAYDTYLLDFDNDNLNFTQITNDVTSQSRTFESRGHKRNLTFGFSQKMSDAFKFGMSLNLAKYRYHQTIDYSEQNSTTINNFNRFTLAEQASSRGNGVNIKVGVASKLGRLLRLSFAYQTPTVYNFSDTWKNRVNSYFYDETTYSSEMEGSFDYYYVSPQKVDLGLGISLLKSLAINVDYSLLDHSTSLFVSKNSAYNLSSINEEVQQELTLSQHLRLGSELRLGNTYLRGGIAYQTSPYSDAEGNGDQLSWGLGIGFNYSKHRFDIGVMNRERRENVYDYAPYTGERTVLKVNETKIACTWQVRF